MRQGPTVLISGASFARTKNPRFLEMKSHCMLAHYSGTSRRSITLGMYLFLSWYRGSLSLRTGQDGTSTSEAEPRCDRGLNTPRGEIPAPSFNSPRILTESRRCSNPIFLAMADRLRCLPFDSSMTCVYTGSISTTCRAMTSTGLLADSRRK